MAQLIKLSDLSTDEKILLLKLMGYGSDGIYVLNKEKGKVMDRYINEPVKIDNMVIFPGSEIILDNNPLSIASFFEEFPDAAQKF